MTISVHERIDRLLAGLNNPALPWIDLSLARMEKLLAALGDPQKRLPPVIHVAGTNGKGSTIAYLRAIYEAAGYQVHVYTSPHLVRFNERIVLAGEEISDALLEQYLQRVADKAVAECACTYFEATTVAAFLAFAERPADILLLEVGLGGRKDATNVAENVVASIITPIGIDHKDFLGDTVDKIAAEKAGILRASVPCITAPQVPEAMEVLAEKAAALGAPLHRAPTRWEGVAPALPGEHQRLNAALAAEVAAVLAERFPVTKAQLAQGIAHARWPARLQRLAHGPLVAGWGTRGAVMLDGGHNAHAAAALAAWIRAQPVPVVAICGLMRRKEAPEFLAPLAAAAARLVFIPIPGAADAYDPRDLQALVPGAAVADSAEAALAPLADVEKGTLLVAGSLHLAGELLKNHG